jgi:hypothetical protein
MDELIEESPFVSYDETLDQLKRGVIPFLQDREIHEYMILQNTEFFIASKCYSYKMRIRRNVQNAHIYIDANYWVVDNSRSFYDLMIHIKAVIEFLDSSFKEMLQCTDEWRKNLSGPFFWMNSVYNAIEENREMFRRYKREWMLQRDMLVAKFERKRILEFAMLLNMKFNRQFGVKVQGITFQILKCIFTFHPRNRSKRFFPTPKRKAECELFP